MLKHRKAATTKITTIAMPNKMDNSSPLLDRSTDPQPGIIYIMCTVIITRPHMERVQLC
jgi:hypothetical protein